MAAIKMADGLGLDAWWDEPAYAASEDIFTKRGAFTVIVLQSSSMQSSTERRSMRNESLSKFIRILLWWRSRAPRSRDQAGREDLSPSRSVGGEGTETPSRSHAA